MKSLYESILSSTNTGKASIIKAWLDEHNIKNYTINSKGEVDVDGDVNLSGRGLTEFPSYIQFGNVKGNFFCNNNNLTTLKGAPKKVGGGFECKYNKLTTLKVAPKDIGGYFECSFNNLISLEGAPIEVNSYFDCSNNKLTSLEGAPERVGMSFICRNNKLTTLKGAPEKVGEWFHCDNNKLTSLEGAPKEANYFNCEKNTTKFSKKDVRKVCKVEKKIYV